MSDASTTPAALPRATGAGAAVDPVLLDGSATFRRVVEALGAGKPAAVGSLWGSSQALVLAGLVARAQGPWLVVVSNQTEAETFADDLATLGLDPVLFPARESYSGGRGAHADPDSIRRRLQVAQRLAGPPERRPRLFVAPLLALLQPLPAPKDLGEQFLHVQVGQHLDTDDLLERLVASGYSRQPLAERPGEASLRGDILDVFPFASDLPFRVELFDEEIESLRTFDPDTQRSIETLQRASFCLASDAGDVEGGSGVPPLSMIAPTTVFVDVEPLRIEDEAAGLRIQSSAHARALTEMRRVQDRHRRISLQSLPTQGIDFDTRSVQALGVGMREAPARVRAEADLGQRVIVLCNTAAEEARFRELLGADGDAGDVGAGVDVASGSGVETRVGSLARGFRLPELKLIVVNHRELAGVAVARRKAPARKKLNVRALESFFELKLGDLVVHAVHGVAQYEGLQRMERAGGQEDHLHLRFADDVSVFVPASRIDLVQRYVGTGSAAPPLDKVGSHAFRKRKEKVERALIDLAAELLEIQAKRELRRRPAWDADPEMVESLIACFPYTDTRDQAEADAEIDRDLRAERPMDRLLCGDVGFGKTEIAVRAAFRVVSAGGQVAVLVPTTVLAQQHYETFRERLADFPVEVAVMSRYVTGKSAKETASRVARGEIDVLIGTHRILSKDVGFKRLGLAIVDEEQRFGVTHKEHFKKLRAEIDVLTLTATPIPRTLHMSLSGLRDISALSEPPEGRQEIETILLWSDERERVREALLREKNRGGQVFFLHNRVQTIEGVVGELQDLVPECTFTFGHGQMTGRQLQEIMNGFVRGESDVLVATTIVENGIDIPSAGTILIDDADRFGLSELHQLRGRVGRGRHKAYCYLVLDRSRPLRQVARERLKALEELTQLGAGFQISMKDLEIRGAGNVLGAEQSGHIAAIGYDMYCRLLKQTVERMAQGVSAPEELLSQVPSQVTGDLEASAVELELGVSAFLPETWIASSDERIEALRRLHGAEDADDAANVLAALRDRYGRIPPEAEALARQFVLQVPLAALGIRRLLWREDAYLLEYNDRVRLEGLIAGRDVELRPLRAGMALLVVPKGHAGDADAALGWIEGILKAATAATKMEAAPS